MRLFSGVFHRRCVQTAAVQERESAVNVTEESILIRLRKSLSSVTAAEESPTSSAAPALEQVNAPNSRAESGGRHYHPSSSEIKKKEGTTKDDSNELGG